MFSILFRGFFRFHMAEDCLSYQAIGVARLEALTWANNKMKGK